MAAIAAEVKNQNAAVAAANRVVANADTSSKKEDVIRAMAALVAATAAKPKTFAEVAEATEAAKAAREVLAPALNDSNPAFGGESRPLPAC